MAGKFSLDLAEQVPNVKKVAEATGGSVIEGRFSKGDILLEVKEDKGCHRTGNVCLEVAYKGNPSGIYAGSDYVVYKIGRNYWRANTEELCRHVENSPEYKRLKGGDGKHSDLVLMPYFDFTQVFTFLFRE